MIFTVGWAVCKNRSEAIDLDFCWPRGSVQCDHAFIGIPITVMLVVGLL